MASLDPPLSLLSKIKPPMKPTSPYAIMQSQEFLKHASQFYPLSLIGRRPDEMIFGDIDFAGSGGVTFGPDWENLLEEEPLIARMLKERGLQESFGTGGFSVVDKSRSPRRGEPKTFRTTLHEQGHVAFKKDKALRNSVLTPEGSLPIFKTGIEIGEEDLLKIIEIRNGLENNFREGFGPGITSNQMAFLRVNLGNMELTKKDIFEDKAVKELLKRLDFEVGGRLNIPKPVHGLYQGTAYELSPLQRLSSQ
jgi:hypothetical protein